MIDDRTVAERFDAALRSQGDQQWVFKLYVAGGSPASQRAVANLSRILDQYLPGRHALEVVDLYQHPEAAKGAEVVAAPTLVRLLPEPVSRVLGDLSEVEQVLVGLDVDTGA